MGKRKGGSGNKAERRRGGEAERRGDERRGGSVLGDGMAWNGERRV